MDWTDNRKLDIEMLESFMGHVCRTVSW